MWPPIDVNPSDQMSPRRDTPGCALQLIWFLLIGWWTSLIITLLAWVLMLSGIGALFGMRLLGQMPRLLFLEHPNRQHLACTAWVADSMDAQQIEQRVTLVRIAYTVVVGWWLGGITLLSGWLMLVSVVGARRAGQLYSRVPRLTTLAVHES